MEPIEFTVKENSFQHFFDTYVRDTPNIGDRDRDRKLDPRYYIGKQEIYVLKEFKKPITFVSKDRLQNGIIEVNVMYLYSLAPYDDVLNKLTLSDTIIAQVK